MTSNELINAAGLLLETSWEMTPDEFAERLEAFVAESGDKLAALRHIAKLAEARGAGCKAEAAAWTNAARAANNRAESVKARAELLYCAARALGEALPGGRMQTNGGAAPLVFAPDFDVTLLPMTCQRVSVEPVAEAIRAAIAAGDELPGVSVGTPGEHFRWTEEPKRGAK